MKFLVLVYIVFSLSTPIYSQVNLSSLGLNLDPPKDEETSADEERPTIDLSFRQDGSRRQRNDTPKNGFSGHGNSASNFAESAMSMLQQYIPGFASADASNTLVDALTRVAGKLLEGVEDLGYVNPIGLPCNPNEVRLCFSKSSTTSTTPAPFLNFLRNSAIHTSKPGVPRRKEYKKQKQDVSPTLFTNAFETTTDEFFAPAASIPELQRDILINRAQEALARTTKLAFTPDVYETAFSIAKSLQLPPKASNENSGDGIRTDKRNNSETSFESPNILMVSASQKAEEAVGTAVPTTHDFHTGMSSLPRVAFERSMLPPKLSHSYTGLQTSSDTLIPRRAASIPAQLNSHSQVTDYATGLDSRTPSVALRATPNTKAHATAPLFKPAVTSDESTSSPPFATLPAKAIHYSSETAKLMGKNDASAWKAWSPSMISLETTSLGLPPERTKATGTTKTNSASRIEQLLGHGIHLVNPLTWINHLFPPTPSH